MKKQHLEFIENELKKATNLENPMSSTEITHYNISDHRILYIAIINLGNNRYAYRTAFFAEQSSTPVYYEGNLCGKNEIKLSEELEKVRKFLASLVTTITYTQEYEL